MSGSFYSERNRAPRIATHVACFTCRKKKAKCDGTRPVCHRCREHENECTWATKGGETRFQALRNTIESLSTRLAEYEPNHPSPPDSEDTYMSPVAGQHVTSTVRAGHASDEASSAFLPGAMLSTNTWPHPPPPSPRLGAPPPPSWASSPIPNPASALPLHGSTGTFASASAFEAEVEASGLLLPGESDAGLTRVYHEFCEAARQRLVNGTPSIEVLGDLGTVDVSLCFRARGSQDGHTVSQWACELLAELRGGIDLLTLLAWTASLTRLMRWIILPCKPTYLQVPPMMQLLSLPGLLPHESMVDLGIQFIFREVLVTSEHAGWRFDGSSSSSSSGAAPWSSNAIGPVDTHPESGALTLTPDFERYVQNVDHWAMASDVVRFFHHEGRWRAQLQAAAHDRTAYQSHR